MSELQLAILGAGIVFVVGVWIYNILQERKHRGNAERLFKGDEADALLTTGGQQAGGERIEPMLHEDAGGYATADDLDTDPAGANDWASAELLGAPAADGATDDAVTGAETATASAVAADADAEVKAGAEADVTSAENTAAPVANESQAAAVPAAAEDANPYAPWADRLADCIVAFELLQPVSAAAVWASQSAWRGQVSKALQWLARESPAAPWQPIGANDSGRFQHWAVALQLADRRGAITDNEIGRFLDGLQTLAGQVGCPIRVPGRSEILQRAQALDEFCARVDIQFGVHVVEVQGGAFAGTKLRGVCEAAGLALGDDGSFQWRDTLGNVEFRVSNVGKERFDSSSIKSLATHGVAFSIDVPCVMQGGVVFDRLLATARQLARGLGGVLVDVQRAPLSDVMIAGIRAKIVEIQETMAAAGIAPGSPRALKLFS